MNCCIAAVMHIQPHSPSAKTILAPTELGCTYLNVFLHAHT